ncbi:tail fiber protein [Oceanicaulis alexandrii]|uniref:phage tail protein n=1 Tax=Oceanicaulis alexandrii TaxID=153233 RepID=UPI0035CEE4E3
MNTFMSMISAFGCNFIIRDWGYCGGGLLAIAQNTTLFSLLGTQFGGNGQVSFGLPDLRGREPVSRGTEPPLSPIIMGQRGGIEDTYVTQVDIPPHAHGFTATGQTSGDTTMMPVSSDPAFGTSPDGEYLGVTSSSSRIYATTLSSPAGTMGGVPIPAQQISITGNTETTGVGNALYVRSPYQGVNFQICMYGLYPSRS